MVVTEPVPTLLRSSSTLYSLLVRFRPMILPCPQAQGYHAYPHRLLFAVVFSCELLHILGYAPKVWIGFHEDAGALLCYTKLFGCVYSAHRGMTYLLQLRLTWV